MEQGELILQFVRRLNQAGIRYMVSGSVAAMFYGRPRFTHDLDCVAFLNEADIRRLPEIFPPSDFYVPPASGTAVSISSTWIRPSKRTFI